MIEPLAVSRLVDEVAKDNFDDDRLNKRHAHVVLHLAKDPKRSLPKSFDEAGLEGAYRFFSNQRVTPMGLLAGHFAATRERCAEHGVVLVAHDSTSFSYRYDGEREGLGRVQRGNERSAQTFFAHLSLAMAADGTRRPLGVIGFESWVRGESRTGVEYQRWEAQIRAVSGELGGPRHAIHLADREADDYEMFCALQRDQHRFVVRCQHDRLLDGDSEKLKLRQHFADTTPSIVERSVPLNRRRTNRDAIKRKTHPPRAARVARLSLAAATVQLKRPLSRRVHGRNDAPPALEINVVRVWEAEPPQGAEPIEWYLYTTESIDTAEQQLAIVDYYRARWSIEEYIKAIKTGCDFEKRQLQDYEALVNLLAVFAPIAYRLLLIRSEAARAPEQSGASILSKDELDVLKALGRRKLPDSPTTRDVYLAIAALGGHIKYAPDPGWLTLARGYEELQTLTTGWIAAKLQLSSDQR